MYLLLLMAETRTRILRFFYVPDAPNVIQRPPCGARNISEWSATMEASLTEEYMVICVFGIIRSTLFRESVALRHSGGGKVSEACD